MNPEEPLIYETRVTDLTEEDLEKAIKAIEQFKNKAGLIEPKKPTRAWMNHILYTWPEDKGIMPALMRSVFEKAYAE